MRSAFDIMVSGALLLGGIAFVAIGALSGNLLQAGAKPFYFAGALCISLSWLAWRTFAKPPPKSFAPTHVIVPTSWFRKKQIELAQFDLAAVNFAGWSLIVLSVAVFFLVVTLFFEQGGRNAPRPLIKVVAVVGLAVAISFFQLVKIGLRRAGVEIVRVKRLEPTVLDDGNEENG